MFVNISIRFRLCCFLQINFSPIERILVHIYCPEFSSLLVSTGGRNQQTVKHKSLQGSPIGGSSNCSSSRKRKNSNTSYDDSHGASTADESQKQQQQQGHEAMVVEETPSQDAVPTGTEVRAATPEQQMKIPRTSGTRNDDDTLYSF